VCYEGNKLINEKLFYQAIGDKIRENRLKNNLKQAELAANIGLERTSITNIEKGNQKVTAFVLFKICKLFKIDFNELLPDSVNVAEYEVQTHNDKSIMVGEKTMSIIDDIKRKS